MTDLEEKAQETPEVSLARQSAPGAYRLEDTELIEADSLTGEGEFPEFGEFVETTNSSGETEYVEVPQDLAAQLVEHEIGTGDHFRIVQVSKIDGSWEYEIAVLEEPPEDRF